ncbi:MAG: hypothetical protein ACR2KF_08560 [Nitrososphaeraceae archaeon]
MIPKTPNEWAKWWRDAGSIPIPSDAVNKRPLVSEWKPLQNGILLDSQFEKWLTEDAYKNGIQIVAGKILGNFAKKGFYLNCIDLDGEAAIKEFLALFGPGATLEKLTQEFIVEQHADKTKAHVFIYTNTRPLKRLKYIVKDANTPKLDILAGGKDLVVVTNSPHKNGSRRELLSDPEKIIYDCVSVNPDELEKKIDTMLSKYGIPYLENTFESEKKNKRDNIFSFDSGEKIPVGSRHVDCVKITNMMIGKLYRLTPEQVIKASIVEYNKNAYEQPLADEEVNKIFNDCLAFKIKQLAEQRDQEIRDFPDIYTNIHFAIGTMPPKYIVASKETNSVIEIVIRVSKSNHKYLSHNKTYLACAPIRIVRHKSPLKDLQLAATFTMTFVDHVGERHTFSHKTLAAIVQSLRDLGYVLGDGAEQALSTVMQGFVKEKLIEDNEEIPYIGFFEITDTNKENKILASNIEIKEPDKSALSDAIEMLTELKPHYENRIDLLSTSMVWGMVAPIIFVLKTNNYFLKAIHLYGFSNATKSNTGKLVLALDGHNEDPRFILNYSRVDSVARFGDAISKSTFPVLIDEIKFDDKNNWLINFIKSAIESRTARTKFMYSKSLGAEDIPSLSVPIFTSNPPPPFHDSGYMRRVITRAFPQVESVNPNDPKAKQFEEFLRINLPRLKALGDFRNWYIMNHQDEILDEKRPTPLDLGLKILKEAFQFCNIEFPPWLEERLPENQLEESMEDNEVIVKRAFEKYIDEQVNRALQIWRLEIEDKERESSGEEKIHLPNEISERFIKLVKSNLLPDIKESKSTFLISKGILTELYNHGVTRDQLPNLNDLAAYMKGTYRKSWGYWVVDMTQAQLKSYFDPKEEGQGSL